MRPLTKLNPKQVFLILTSHSAVQISARHQAATNGLLHNNTIDMTGDLEDRDFITTRGDARISMTISKNADTVKFGRESRFLIDDYDSEEKLSYSLSKPLRVGWHYNNEGIYVFVLKEANSTDDDNTELGIADYYKYFPKDNTQDDDTKPGDDSGATDKKGWL